MHFAIVIVIAIAIAIVIAVAVCHKIWMRTSRYTASLASLFSLNAFRALTEWREDKKEIKESY